MGMTQLFWKLVRSPDASPNTSNICVVRFISSSVGRMNNATSSAYREIRCPSLPLVNGCNKPSPYALVNRLFKTSMTKINSIGDRGSPCRRPRWCPITSPGSPLTKILVDAVVSRRETKLHQAVPKPKCCKISNRNEVSDCAACPFVVGSYATQRLFYHSQCSWYIFPLHCSAS